MTYANIYLSLSVDKKYIQKNKSQSYCSFGDPGNFIYAER